MTKQVNITTDSGANPVDVSAAVASTIKAYRRERSLSLDELSRRSGVSKGMLVEIEKGSANPSIAILCKVAAAFGISVADIVNVSESTSVHLIAFEEAPILWKGDKGGSARLLAGTSGADMVELWRWILFPGETFESKGHPRGTTELLHVENGTLSLQVKDSVFQVPSGSSAVARTDAPHSYSNQESTDLIFYMTVSEPHGS